MSPIHQQYQFRLLSAQSFLTHTTRQTKIIHNQYSNNQQQKKGDRFLRPSLYYCKILSLGISPTIGYLSPLAAFRILSSILLELLNGFYYYRSDVLILFVLLILYFDGTENLESGYTYSFCTAYSTLMRGLHGSYFY